MAVSFPRLPRWLCGCNTKGSSSMNPPSKKTKSGVKKMKRGSGEEKKMGNVIFPKPDEPEWSIGWVEPHGPGFKGEDGFVVLVPCYKKVIDGLGNQIPNGFFSPAPDVKDMEQLLSSMGKLLTGD